MIERATELALKKIHRAMGHANEVDVLIEAYEATKPYTTTLKPGSEHEFFELTAPPPPEIGIIAGEVFYQVRSALDHVFFELLQRNLTEKPLPADWERRSEFPLHTTAPSGVTPPVPRDKFPSPFRDHLTDQALIFLERIQPYNRHSDSAAEELSFLAKFSNIDKHRRLNTTSIHATQIESAKVAGGTITTFGLVVKPGTEMRPLSQPPELPREFFHVTRDIELVVAFDEPTVMPPGSAEVSDVLHGVTSVGRWVVWMFENHLFREQ